MELPDFAQNSTSTMAPKSSTHIEFGDHQDFANDFGDFNQFDAEDDDFGDFAAGTADFEDTYGGRRDAYGEAQHNTQSASHDLVGQAPQILSTTDEHDTTDEDKDDSVEFSDRNAQESNNAVMAGLDRGETGQSDDDEKDLRDSHHVVDDSSLVNSDLDDRDGVDGNSEIERSTESHRQTETPGSPYVETGTHSSITIDNEPTKEALSADHAERLKLVDNSVTQNTSYATAPDNELAALRDEDHNDEHFRLEVVDEHHDNYKDGIMATKSDEENEVSFPDLKENENADTNVSEDMQGDKDAYSLEEDKATEGFAAVKDDKDAADSGELDGAIATSEFADVNEDEDEDEFGDFGDTEATEEFADFGDVEGDKYPEENWGVSDTMSKEAQVHSEANKTFVPTELQRAILSANFKQAEVAISVWDKVLGYLLPLSNERDKSDLSTETETVKELVMRAHESLYPTISWHALTVSTDDDNGIPKVQWRNSRIEKMYLDALNASRQPKITSPPPPSTSSPTVKPNSLSATSSPSSNVDTAVAMPSFQQISPKIENIVMADKPVEAIGVSEAQTTTISEEAKKTEKVTIVPKITTSRLPASDSAPASASSGKDLFHLSSVMSPPLSNDHSPPRPVPTRHASSPAIHAEPVHTPVNEATAVSVAAKSNSKKRHTMEIAPQQARSPSPLSQSLRSGSYSRSLTPTKFATQSQNATEISPALSTKTQLQSSPNASGGSLGNPSFTERIQSPETERSSMDLEHISEVSNQPDVSSFPVTSPPAMQSEVQDSWLTSNDISFLDTLGGHSVNKPKSKPSSQKVGLGIIDIDIFEAANSPAPNSKPSSTTSAWETLQDPRQKRGSGPQNDVFNTKERNATRSTLTKSPPVRPTSVRSPSAKSTWAKPLSPVRSQTIASSMTTSQRSPPAHSQSPPSDSAFNGFGDFGDFASGMMQAQPVPSASSDSRWDVFRSASLSGSLSEWSTELTNPASPSKTRESNASSSLNVGHKENSAADDDDEFGDFSAAAGDGEFGDFGSTSTTWDINQAYQFPSDPSKGWI